MENKKENQIINMMMKRGEKKTSLITEVQL